MVPGRVLALALLLGVAAPASAEELTLSVAISMKDAIEELGRGFTQARPGVVLRHNLGASGELSLWDRVQGKLVFAENVRQALDYVARGEVDAGFVYATDAAVRPGRVKEAFRPAEDTYRPVTYSVAMVRESRHKALAQAFIDALLSASGQAVLRRFGFLPATA